MSEDRIIRMKLGRQPVDFDNQELLNRTYGYISWGKKNDTPYKYIDMLHKSAVHQGIINSKVSYIISDGFEVLEGGSEAEEFLKNGQIQHDINDVAEACILDFEVFDMFAVRGIWSMDGTKAYFEHLDFDKLRATEEDDTWIYSDDWSNGRQSPEKTGLKEYKVLDLNNRSGEFIVVYKSPTKQPKGCTGIYSIPKYSGGLDAIQTDIEISRYHLKEILNGFSGGTMVTLPEPAPETEEEIQGAKDFKRKLTSSQNAGEVFLYYVGEGEKEIKVVHLSGNDLDKRYDMLEKSTMEKIMIAHSVTSPMLMGIKTEGQLGGTQELETAFNIFNSTYISKRQKAVNWVFNLLMNKCNGVDGKVSLKEATLPFSVTQEQKNNFYFEKKKNDDLDSVIQMFAKCGKPLDECNLITGASMEVPQDFTSPQVHAYESELLKEMFADVGGVNIENKTSNILSLINKNESPATIAKIVGDKPESVVREIDRLKEKGYISANGEITSKGLRLLDLTDSQVEDLEVRYTYEKRGGVDGSDIISTTRDFCRELINLNRAYTRQEIDTISSIVGRDVWSLRGGWYHDPSTGRNLPFCRHIWRFNLTRR